MVVLPGVALAGEAHLLKWDNDIKFVQMKSGLWVKFKILNAGNLKNKNCGSLELSGISHLIFLTVNTFSLNFNLVLVRVFFLSA